MARAALCRLLPRLLSSPSSFSKSIPNFDDSTFGFHSFFFSTSPSVSESQTKHELGRKNEELERPNEVILTQEQSKYPTPKLSVRETKELASYAHSLGKELSVQHVGKKGISESVAAYFIELLECHELLKIKVSGNCPGKSTDVIKQLEESTGSTVVDQIGRTTILYRPSLTKMEKDRTSTLKKSK